MNELNFKYPLRFTFNLVRDVETGEQYVSAQPTNNQKCNLENIKYLAVRHFSMDSKKEVALLDVLNINSEKELKECLEEYEGVWGIKVDAKEVTTHE